MLTVHLPLLLLGVLFAPLALVLIWSFLHFRRHHDGDFNPASGDGLLLAMLILAAFGLGVFLTYIMIGFAH